MSLTQKKNAPPAEKELLSAVAASDQGAFHLLVDLYWGRVYHNTLNLVRSPQKAQEITQDIFLKIWNQRAQLTSIEGFAQYIYVVGRNYVISAMRRKLMETTPLHENISEDHHTPEQLLHYKETHRLVMQGVARLTPQQQLTFTMSRMEGLSHEEIASRLGLSRSTVKNHLVLALHFLRRFIRDHREAENFS